MGGPGNRGTRESGTCVLPAAHVLPHLEYATYLSGLEGEALASEKSQIEKSKGQ